MRGHARQSTPPPDRVHHHPQPDLRDIGRRGYIPPAAASAPRRPATCTPKYRPRAAPKLVLGTTNTTTNTVVVSSTNYCARPVRGAETASGRAPAPPVLPGIGYGA